MAKTLHSVYCGLQLSSRTRALLCGAAILWIASLAYFSLLRLVPHAPAGSTTHRLEHAAAFGVLGLLLLPLCPEPHTGMDDGSGYAGSEAAALELGQHTFFRNVGFEWWDVRDDAIGLVMAWLVVRRNPAEIDMIRPGLIKELIKPNGGRTPSSTIR